MTNQNPSWVRYIRQRIDNNKNFLGIIMGPTGSGKSWSALAMAEMIDPNFNENNIIFRARDLLRLINGGTLKAGSVIIWDEAGIDLSNRNWQSVMNKMLNYLLQTFRARNFILLFTAPYSDFIDAASRKLFHAQFETLKISRVKNTCGIKPKLLQYNSAMNKFYYHFLKAEKNGRYVKIKKWNLPKPSEEIINIYEQKKREFTDGLNQEIENSLLKLEKDSAPTIQGDYSVKKPLTDKQQMALELLQKEGLRGVAKKMGISVTGVASHISAIKRKGIPLFPIRKDGEEATHYEIREVYRQKA